MVEDVSLVAIAKFTDDWPAARLRVAGTTALIDELVRLKTAPPGGAGAVRVTVPVTGSPPGTEVGLTVNAEMSAGE